jgi:hypothetical protein
MMVEVTMMMMMMMMMMTQRTYSRGKSALFGRQLQMPTVRKHFELYKFSSRMMNLRGLNP